MSVLSPVAEQSSVHRADWAVVTANMAAYDEVHAVPPDAHSADWVYVTDATATAERAAALGWRVVMRDSTGSPFVRSRYPKARPDAFTNRPKSIYVDARFEVQSEGVIDSLSGYLSGEVWLALFKHPHRWSVYDEAEECRRLGIGSAQITDQMRHYRAIGVEHPTGLWCGGVIVRRHCNAQIDFGQAWFDELIRWPTRDQLSLPIVLQQSGVAPASLPGSIYAWPGLRVTPHLARRPGQSGPPRQKRAIRWLRSVGR